MGVADFLYWDVDNWFRQHGHVTVLIDVKLGFRFFHGRGGQEECSTREVSDLVRRTVGDPIIQLFATQDFCKLGIFLRSRPKLNPQTSEHRRDALTKLDAWQSEVQRTTMINISMKPKPSHEHVHKRNIYLCIHAENFCMRDYGQVIKRFIGALVTYKNFGWACSR